MISAFAKGAAVLEEPRYAQAARRAADFMRARLWRESGPVLLRRYRDGSAAVEGFLDDYAFLALGLLDLYEVGFDSQDLRWAGELVERAMALFEDPQAGGFFSTAENKADLILRLKDDYDGAEPSGNSAMALALIRLARMTGAEKFDRGAQRTLQAFAPRMRSAGAAIPQMLAAQMFASGKSMEIVLAGPRDRELLLTIRGRFLPQAVTMSAQDAPTPMPAVNGKPTAYVCENFACRLPVTSAAALAELLQ
jgi:hypothetical protein